MICELLAKENYKLTPRTFHQNKYSTGCNCLGYCDACVSVLVWKSHFWMLTHPSTLFLFSRRKFGVCLKLEEVEQTWFIEENLVYLCELFMTSVCLRLRGLNYTELCTISRCQRTSWAQTVPQFFITSSREDNEGWNVYSAVITVKDLRKH